MRTKTVSITNAELKALRATPKTIVAAQGAGRFIEFLGAMLYLDAGTNVLTESADNLVFRYTNSSGVVVSNTIEMTGFIDQSADMLIYCTPLVNAIPTAALGLNAPLVLHNNGDGEFAGNAAADATLSVRVMYRVHRFP
jgi:hypothetical protein